MSQVNKGPAPPIQTQDASREGDPITHSIKTDDDRALARACVTALESDPDDVRALAALGRLMHQQGRFSQATKLLDKAVTLMPDDVPLLAALGESLLDDGRLEVAQAVLRRASALQPENPTVCRHRGRLLFRMAHYEEAYAVIEAGLVKMPDDDQLRLLSGQILISLKRLAEAKQRLEQVTGTMPEDPWPHLGIALIHFLQGELLEGFAAYRWRKKLPECQPRKYTQPYWWGGDAVGKTILVYAEQGLGDTLHFARYLPLLVARGAHVLLVCDPKLHGLMRGMEGVTLVQPNVHPQFDCHVSLLDLPGLFGTRLETIPADLPYLRAPKKIGLPQRLPGCRLRIGIVWAGNPKHNNSRNRDCRIEQFLSLAWRCDVELFSLQVGQPATALSECGAEVLITPLGSQLGDMGITAAVMDELDLIITIDSATAHLSGALNKPTWLLLPYAPDWRWMLDRSDTPWYPAMRLFRQTRPGDWHDVFMQVGQALDRLLEGRVAQSPATAEAVAQARQMRDRATERYKRGNLQGAMAMLRNALRQNPLEVSLWNNMGIFLREAGFLRAAEACYRRGLDCGGEADAGLRSNLGNVLNDLERSDEAVACQELALELNRNSTLFMQNLGVALRGAGRHADAVAVYDRLLEKSPEHHDARWDRSQSLLSLGHFAGGWRDYESRWKLKEAGPYPRKGARWNGKSFKGKTLLLVAEQGFGDTVLAVRFLPMVKKLGGRVMLECQPELMRLFGKQCGADAIFAKGTPPPEPYDFQLTLMSLPGLFVKQTADILPPPYLATDRESQAMFANLLNKKPGQFNIGIVWSGSVTFKGNAFRALTIEPFLRFAAIPGIRLFSLQKGSPQVELNKLDLPSMVTDLSPLLLDFSCTAAALQMLDLVIMTDSATAHLAGALGRPVWVLLGSRPYWLWGNDELTPWYPDTRLFRQRKAGDWDELFERVEQALRAWRT